MKFIPIPGAVATAATLFSKGESSGSAGTITVSSGDTIFDIIQRPVTISDGGALPPYNMEFVAACNTILSADIVQEGEREYVVTAAVVPGALTESTMQALYPAVGDLPIVIQSGCSKLVPPAGGDLEIADFSYYRSNAESNSTFVGDGSNSNYGDDTKDYVILAAGAAYRISGSFYVADTSSGGEHSDPIKTIRVAYKLDYSGGPTYGLFNVAYPAPVLDASDNITGYRVVVDEVIDLVSLGINTEVKLFMYIDDYEEKLAHPGVPGGLLGVITADKTSLVICDLNAYPDTKVFGPFPLFDAALGTSYSIIFLVQAVTQT